MRPPVIALALLLSGGSAASCSAPTAESGASATEEGLDQPPPIEAPPLLPLPAGAFAPSHVALAPDDPGDAERLADVQSCADCHPDAYRTWRSSAHARASFDNPWYRQGVDAFRAERGNEASRFCAGCHDPVLLVAGGMDAGVNPEDPRAQAGITCRVCHGVREVRPDGVGSYTLSTAELFLPDPAKPDEVERHVREVTPDPLRSSELCGSCHRGFLGEEMGNPHHLAGTDDLSAWRASAYAGSRAARVDEAVEEASCQDCHMPGVEAVEGDFARDDEGSIHSHRFAGGHSALANATGDEAQLAAERASLIGAARIDIPVIRDARDARAPLDPEAGLDALKRGVLLDVVVHNTATGHRFPGGLRDAQDTWVAVELRDAQDRPVASAHVDHRGRADEEAHVLTAWALDADARPDRRHRVEAFHSILADRTIGPRDAALVRYRLSLPSGFSPSRLPLSITARLLHRSRPEELHRAACDSQRSERGRAFDDASRALGRVPIDACREQPVTEVASARVWIGEGAHRREPAGGALAPRWRRAFDHGLAVLGGRQEDVDEARSSLVAALELAREDLQRAAALAQMGRLEARQGRLDEALAFFDRAEALIGSSAALDRMRGQALARVWRWEPAAGALGRAAIRAPLDAELWAALARATGSVGDAGASLEASRRGLTLRPRHESLLRSQFLALAAHGSDEVDEVRRAFVTHRAPDDADALVARCVRDDPRCASRRAPVPVYPLVLVD